MRGGTKLKNKVESHRNVSPGTQTSSARRCRIEKPVMARKTLYLHRIGLLITRTVFPLGLYVYKFNFTTATILLF